MKHAILTNDVETHSIWYNTLRDETGVKVLKEGMPFLLDLYEELGVQSTFYIVGNMAEKFPEVVKMILPYGHEIASHGYDHEVDQAFDVLSYAKQVEHLSKSKKILEDLSGREVISFRAPALRVNSDTPRALIETGYKIDSSIASQRFDAFLSFGGLKKLSSLGAPRQAYKTREDNLSRRGNSNLVELPLTAFGLPFVSTTMRIFPGLTGFQRHLFHLETGLTGKPMVFDTHPNEFIEEGEGEERQITRRTQNPFAYLFADLLRGKMKVKNLGKEGMPVYKKHVEFYKNRGYEMNTVQSYCKKQGLI